MKISLIFFLLTTSLFCQSQDTHIKDFFNSLNNKTILIEIFENQSVFNANISLNDPKIYFETIEVDSTVSLFENNVITSYDLSKKNIIIENSEKNILDFFSYKNFENFSLIKIEYKVLADCLFLINTLTFPIGVLNLICFPFEGEIT